MIQERICANRSKTTIREHQHSLQIQPPLIAPGRFGVSRGRKRNAKPAGSDERRLYSKANINKDAMFVCFVSKNRAKEHGTSGTRQMVQDFPIISVKTRNEEYLWRYSSFSEKFPVEKSVPFDFSPEQPVFPCKLKTPEVLIFSACRLWLMDSSAQNCWLI